VLAAAVIVTQYGSDEWRDKYRKARDRR